jgi:hypothetical protein
MKLLVALFVSMAVAGCAIHDGRPKVGAFEVIEQNKLKSAAHWRVVAEDVAGQISAKAPAQPVFIPSGTDTTFSKVFASQLRSSLLAKGYALSPTKAGALEISVTVEEVQHVTLNRYSPGTLSKLAAGVLVLREFTDTARQAVGAVAGLLIAEDIIRSAQELDKRPNTEIVLTSVATKDGVVLSHNTDVYYLDSVDSSLFSVTGRQFKVVGGKR